MSGSGNFRYVAGVQNGDPSGGRGTREGTTGGGSGLRHTMNARVRAPIKTQSANNLHNSGISSCIAGVHGVHCTHGHHHTRIPLDNVGGSKYSGGIHSTTLIRSNDDENQRHA